MLRYEFKKIFSQKAICVLLLLLWVLFCAVFIGDVKRIGENTVPAADADAFFDLYVNQPETVLQAMADRKAEKDEYDRITMKMTREEAEQYGPFAPEDRFIHSDRFSDDSLYELLEKRLTYTTTYAADLKNVIRQAKANKDEYLGEDRRADPFLIRYQDSVIRSYEKVLSEVPAIGFENVHGWGTLFQSETADFFIVLSVILFSSCVFLQERTSGFQQILKTSKNGRGKTVLRKWIVLISGTAFLTVFYILTEAAVIGGFLGYSSGLNYVSAIETFRLFPYPMTMFGFLSVFVLLKILAAGLLGTVVAFVSTVAGKIETIYLSGVLFFSAGLLSSFLAEDHFLSRIGFVRTFGVKSLLQKAVYYRIFGFPVPCIVFNAAVYLLLTLVLIALSFVVICRCPTARVGRTRLFPGEEGPFTAAAPRSLLGWEICKRMTVSRMGIVLIAVILLGLGLSAVSLKPNETASEEYYQDYLSEVHGQWTEETGTYLEKEKNRIAEAIAMGEGAKEYFLQGLIGEEEYDRIENEYFDALFRKDAFERVERQAEYLKQRRDDGRTAGWMIDTDPWEKLFFGSGYYLILAWVVLLSSGLYPFEYGTKDGGFASILHSTKKGGGETFRAKTGAAVILTALGYASVTAVTLLVFRLRFGWKDLNAPLCSIERFSDVDGGITVGGTFFLFLGVPLAAFLLLSVITACVSRITKSTLVTLCIATVLSFTAELAEMSGAENARHFNILHLFSGSEAVRISARADLLGWDYSELCIMLAVFTAICVGIVLVSCRRAGNGNKEKTHASVVSERQ